jgi:hypothetical protein
MFTYIVWEFSGSYYLALYETSVNSLEIFHVFSTSTSTTDTEEAFHIVLRPLAKTKRCMVAYCFSALLLPAATLNAQTVRDANFDLGGFRLRAIISGKGKPVVVFESGMGEDISTWKDVQPTIAKLTRTFTYDRAGLGKSDASPRSPRRLN